MEAHRATVFGLRPPATLAEALLCRILDRDLPAGASLCPASLGPVMAAREDQLADALRLLEHRGVAVREGKGWIVSHDRKAHAREILSRGGPVLLAIARLAAEHATPAEAAAITSARDRIGGMSGDGEAATRAAAYREMMEKIAAASGCRFYQETLGRMLDETAELALPIAERYRLIYPVSNPDGELVRLAEAIMAADTAAAETAMEDHLMLLACHMDALPEE